MNEEKTGLEKAREVVTRIKVENVQEEEVKEKAKENALAALSQNTDLAKMYAESANVGADNLGGSLPLLKVHATGKSTKNELQDGTEPNNGWFFYKPTQEQFEALRCHILTISQGFRSPDMNGKEIFQQIVGGVIVDEGDYKPFIMYMTGLKLQNVWEFGKAAKKYTHTKPVPIPMFALTVKLTTENKENSFGKSWIVNFEIEKTEDGAPVLVMDPGEFQFLKDHVAEVEATINSLISTKSSKDAGEEEQPIHLVAHTETQSTQVADDAAGDIPF